MSGVYPSLVYFRQILPGDLRKYEARSNNAQTGGGARDLRVRPGKVFGSYVQRMFPNPGTISGKSTEGVFHGTINWIDASGQRKSMQLEYWRPTDARPDEPRIGRFYTCDAWAVDAATQNAIKAEKRWFYSLVQDTDGCVWARTFSEDALPQMDAGFRAYVLERIRATRADRAIAGVYDFTADMGIRA